MRSLGGLKLSFTPNTPFSSVAIRTVLKLVRRRRRQLKFEIAQLEGERAMLRQYDASLTSEYGPEHEDAALTKEYGPEYK